ncbi:MAG: hypothetical protein E7172_02740 [Firmicutes bacterium]|nr:hypothetical protein [Bacillota bacterium]
MKETINYYYNLDINELEEKDGRYHFVFNKKDYFFVYYNRLIEELDEILKCVSNMKQKNIDCHNILLNINGNVLTKIADKDYILFEVTNMEEEYDITDMIKINERLVLSSNFSKLYRNNWATLWSEKIDYFEYQIRELGLHKKVILETFSYYLGLAENAISYVYNTTKNHPISFNDQLVLSHRRIFYPNLKLNYMNPLSFIFDLEVRDIAEYLKSVFFSSSNIDPFLELVTYLKIKKLTIYSYQMLIARLLYPSYYFDLYEDIMNNEKDENKLIPIISKVNEYEIFLKKAFLEILKYAPIAKIEWILNR